MTKLITIDPVEARKTGVLIAPQVPLNAYQPNPAAEAQKYGTDNLVRIYRDMAFIREFETMLDSIKRQGAYQGIEYNHLGPAHLSIGQEASSVGQAYNLTPEDYIFGSHRSHGEILAKSLSAIQKLSDADLLKIMETYLDGAPLRVVEKIGTNGSVKGLAIYYTLYGTLAEIFGRAAGFNKGMGGSMHAFFAPFGVMPNNAIVGGSADIATGSALYKRVNRKPGIVIANIGDASMGCGPVWEAMMFAAMDQYRTLWPEEAGGAPPSSLILWTTSTAWAANRRARPWATARWPASAWGSTRKACTPSGWTATIRWPWPMPSSANGACWKKGAARCCWIPSPIASAATPRPMPRPIAPKRRWTPGGSRIRC
jgi:2-oxoisovalerate dehydrogenase E1 component